MKDIIFGIFSILKESMAGNLIFPMYLVSLVYLFFAKPEKRRIIIGPSVLLMLVIFAPHLYQYVYLKVFKYAYWRAFWLIPAVPVIACAVVSLLTDLPKKWMKAAASAALAVIICIGGTNAYSAYMTDHFTRAANAYKIPQAVVDVDNALLAMDSRPYVVMHPDLFCYSRVYSSNIMQMYGRDAYSFISHNIDDEAKSVFDQMSSGNPDYAYVADIMRKRGYSYLVIRQDEEPADGVMEACGFSFRQAADGYLIYALAG